MNHPSPSGTWPSGVCFSWASDVTPSHYSLAGERLLRLRERPAPDVRHDLLDLVGRRPNLPHLRLEPPEASLNVVELPVESAQLVERLVEAVIRGIERGHLAIHRSGRPNQLLVHAQQLAHQLLQFTSVIQQACRGGGQGQEAADHQLKAT